MTISHVMFIGTELEPQSLIALCADSEEFS